ncbi:Bug family tripartite tricarboxylate transporter substrate binding protein [Salinibacillus xinjiangensis]|nr:tripartite tricarboxylate transporter substrate binding protein [Salinibacillus xinjiangensis]
MIKKLLIAISFILVTGIFVACSSTSSNNQESENESNNNNQSENSSETAGEFPSKPLRLVVQYPAGGGVDVTARLFAKHAEKYLGQKIIVENIEGGSGAVGVTEVAQANADGYTMGVMIPNTITDEFLLPNVSYNAESFTPIVQINSDPSIIATHNDSGIESLEDLVNKSKNEDVSIGIGAVWTTNDFVKLALEEEAGIEMTRVPYQGGAPVTQALLAGDLNVGTQYPAEIKDYYDSGELKGLAISTSKRTDTFSDIPTFKEQGYDIEFNIWRMISVPAGTPEDRIKILEEAFMKTLQDQATIDDFESSGLALSPLNTEESKTKVQEEYEKYKELIDTLGLEPGATP